MSIIITGGTVTETSIGINALPRDLESFEGLFFISGIWFILRISETSQRNRLAFKIDRFSIHSIGNCHNPGTSLKASLVGDDASELTSEINIGKF